MRAVYCLEPGRLELRDVPRPQPGPTEVLLKVHSCGICGSDLHYYNGGLPVPAVCPGHEISGEVVEVAGGVDRVGPGDRVAVEPLITCGQCPACRVGDYQLCRSLQIAGTQVAGGFAEYMCMPAAALFKLPDEIDWPLGAMAEPTAVCVHAVRLAQVSLGDRVLVLGAGAIGLLAVLAARAAGAAEVLITARHPHQSDAARRLGARVFEEGDDGALAGYALVHPVDVVIETVGGEADTLRQALSHVRPGGVVCVLGVFTHSVPLNPVFLILKEARIVGSMTYGRAGPRADFDTAIELLLRHRGEVAPLVTHQLPLSEIEPAFAIASDKSRGSIKVSVRP